MITKRRKLSSKWKSRQPGGTWTTSNPSLVASIVDQIWMFCKGALHFYQYHARDLESVIMKGKKQTLLAKQRKSVAEKVTQN